ncbi:Twk-22 [Aphelenchoides bicaudatus]|nr:Twk-22 [Aphelenchoides bicaudatus]
MDSSENEKTKEAFKVLERYAKKRYEQAQNFFLSANSENVPALNSAKSILSRSRFSFHPELKRQHSILSDDGSLDAQTPEIETAIGDEAKPEKQYLIHRESLRSYLWRVSKFLYERGFKHVLILLLVIVYTLLGALIFYWLEADVDHSSRAIIRGKIEQRQLTSLEALKNLLLFEDCLVGKESTEIKISDSCTEKLTEIIQWLANHVEMDSGGGSSKSQWQWDYWNAVFFSLSISTTIGYGNLACKTFAGRLATIVYGLFGIPLMLFLLNSIGHVMFTSVEAVWKQAKKMLKKKTRRVRKHIMAGIKTNGKFYMSADNMESKFRQNTDATIIEETVEEEDQNIFETFPILLAVVIVFIYVLLCSVIMCMWEDWSYFQAFYFFFISISTIGFGDEMPDHPRYAICFFIFFIIGLSLGSMCITIMQMRVENKYMQALQLIDDQHQLLAGQPQVVIETPDQRMSPDEQQFTEHPILKASNRWKHPSALAINNEELANNLSNRLNSVSECLSPAEYYASPILNALIKRRHGSSQQNIVRQFSRSVTATANASLDTESSSQSPSKQNSADFLDLGSAPRRLRPKHLWKEPHSPFRTSVSSIHTPLTIIVESKNDEAIPPLAEQDTDSNGTHSSSLH